MMARPLHLEDFDTSDRPMASGAAATATGRGADVDLEEERLKSYETGYGAGWDDATSALAREQERISSEFSRHLQELSFTYHEAHAALKQQIAEVVRGLVSRVLPRAAHPALGETIVARVAEIAGATHVDIEIVVAPENTARMLALTQKVEGPPMRIAAEPSLGAGQAFLRFGATEEKLDLDAVLTEMTEAVDRYFDGPQDTVAESADPNAKSGNPKEASNG